MTMQKVTAVYFSPTRGTAHYAEAVAAALAPSHDTVNLTVPFVRKETHRFGPEDLVVIGAPVYAGRLPAVPGLWDGLEGHDTPAVFLVSYGNRAYDDALLELKDLCEAKGFRGVAASAWIAPHTFSAKIGAGRPDESDLAKTAQFAQAVRALLDGGVPEGARLDLPGRRPYRDAPPMPFHPEVNEDCVRCRRCAAVCPAEAIDPAHPEKTDPAKCIDCLACVRACPVHARGVYHPPLAMIAAGCESKFLSPRREPEWHLAGI